MKCRNDTKFGHVVVEVRGASKTPLLLFRTTLVLLCDMERKTISFQFIFGLDILKTRLHASTLFFWILRIRTVEPWMLCCVFRRRC